jgi:hypothetical protein
MNTAGSPLHRTGLGSPQASLFHTRPPFLIFHDMPLSCKVFVVGETFLLVCSRSRPGSDRSHLVTFDAPIFYWNAGPLPENHKDTPRESNQRPPHAKEISPYITPDQAPPKGAESFEVFCSTELCNRTVNKRTFQRIITTEISSGAQHNTFPWRTPSEIASC